MKPPKPKDAYGTGRVSTDPVYKAIKFGEDYSLGATRLRQRIKREGITLPQTDFYKELELRFLASIGIPKKEGKK